MKLWKAPVFYVGIFLMLAVAAALIAPLIVDWGRYRESIENFGLRVTGREVAVEGPISVQLFPWPRLTLDKVRIANPQSAQNPVFARAERIDVKLSLAGFFNGNVQVESIEILKPALSFERLAAGKGTWQMAPTLLAGDARILESVKLDRISVVGGTADLIDGLRGGHARIEAVNAQLSAPGLAGPWRLRGNASFGGTIVDVSVNTGLWSPDEDLKFGFKLAPQGGAGFVYAFDGVSSPAAINGTLFVDSVAAEQGKSDPEGQLRPLTFKSKVAATFDAVNFDNIEISPKDAKEGGNLLTGSGKIALGSEITVDSKLKATRFDLDAVAGAQARRVLREGSGLSFLEGILDALPESVGVKTDVTITSLVAGGESLENVKLKLDVSADAMRITELRARMPGQSEALFDGVFVVTEKGPQLAGDIALESFNLRDLSKWVWPEHAGGIKEKWTGSRGHLKLETRLDAAPGNFRLSDAEFSLDGALGKGSLSIAGGPPASINIGLNSDLVDLDNFLPSGAAIKEWNGLIGSASGWNEVPNINLSLKTQRLRLNGAEANDVHADVALSASSLNIRHLKIQQAGDARLEASGALQLGGQGPAGAISAQVLAHDPRPLLQLFGLYPVDKEPAWARALGPSDLKLRYELKPGQASQQADVFVEGQVGVLAVSTSLRAQPGANLENMHLAGAGQIKSPSSKALAALAGFQPAADVDSPGEATLALSGSLAEGLSIDTKAKVFGAELQYAGTVKNSDAGLAISGRAGVLTETPKVFFSALGWAGYPEGLYTVEANVTGDDAGFGLTGITGLLAGERLSGGLTGSWDGKVNGEFATGITRLGDVLTASFLPWNGKGVDLSGSFSQHLPGGLTGEIWIRPARLEFFDGFDVPEAQIGIVAAGDSLQLALFGKTAQGKDVKFEIRRKQAGSEQELSGELRGEIDLGKYLKTQDSSPALYGATSVDLKWTGKGRTPASVLASLNGSGSFNATDVKLARVDVKAFSTSIANAATALEVKRSIEGLTGGSQFDLGDISGSLTLTDGTAAFLPARVSGADADVAIKPLFDVASRSLDLDITLQINSPPGLPPIKMSYLGEPWQLVRNVDASVLESTLGMQILRKGMIELETLQREQQKLLEEEQKQAQEDAKKLSAWEEHRREMQRRVRELNTLQRNWIEQQRRQREQTDGIVPVTPPPPGAKSSLLPNTYPYGPVFGSQEQVVAPDAPAPKPKPRNAKLVNKPAKPAAPVKLEIQVPVILVPAQLPPQAAPWQPPERRNNFNR